MLDPYLDRKNKRIDRSRCSFCQTTLADVWENRFLGCSRCYATFIDQVRSILNNSQKGTIHKGKYPLRWSRKRILEHELRNIHKDYKQCLAEENYEKAEQLKRKMERIQTALSE